MDSVWQFRHAYDEARKVKEAQDSFCESVRRGRWDELADEPFPESLEWEALVDVLRGKVKVCNMCSFQMIMHLTRLRQVVGTLL